MTVDCRNGWNSALLHLISCQGARLGSRGWKRLSVGPGMLQWKAPPELSSGEWHHVFDFDLEIYY